MTDQLPQLVDRFNQWLAVDPVTGDVNLSFYDTRNDTSGFRFMTDTFFTQSVDGGVTFRSPNVRVSSVSSNEQNCNGVFPCPAINYGNQQGDYEGLASRGGVSHPIWTDSRRQLESSSGCRTNLLMEEVFTATVKGGCEIVDGEAGSSAALSLALFHVCRQPIRKGLVPELRVLRLQYPVSFVRKDHQLRWHALPLERAEKFQRLRVRHAVVSFAGNH